MRTDPGRPDPDRLQAAIDGLQLAVHQALACPTISRRRLAAVVAGLSVFGGGGRSNSEQSVSALANEPNVEVTKNSSALAEPGAHTNDAHLGALLDATTFPGVDPTGRSDSTEGLQRALDQAGGRVLRLPQGDYLVARDLLIRYPGITLIGPGRLCLSAPGVRVLRAQAQWATVAGVKFANPNEFVTKKGARETAVSLESDDASVVGCTIEAFPMGIVVEKPGHRRAVIVGNKILDAIGAGGGPGSRDSAGEDRGDGITVWSPDTIIVGNHVEARSSTDARIGIHVEYLTHYTPVEHRTEQVIATMNTVVGPWRRCLAVENAFNVVVTDNILRGGTWWTAYVGAVNIIFSRNILISEGNSRNIPGANWNPRVGLLNSLVGGANVIHRVKIVENVMISRRPIDFGIRVMSAVRDVEIMNNWLGAEEDKAWNPDLASEFGIQVRGANSVRIVGNNLGRNTTGIDIKDCHDIEVAHNVVRSSRGFVGRKISRLCEIISNRMDNLTDTAIDVGDCQSLVIMNNRLFADSSHAFGEVISLREVGQKFLAQNLVGSLNRSTLDKDTADDLEAHGLVYFTGARG